jgi:hypothetical protein
MLVLTVSKREAMNVYMITRTVMEDRIGTATLGVRN